MMRITKIVASVLGLVVTIGLTQEGNASWYMQEDLPNDSPSRGLNEMKAKARPVPPVADPRDARIAALEKQISELDAELGRLRGTAGNLSDANRRISELEQQLADRDRELTSLRSSAGDSARLASQLSSAQADNDRLAAELAASQASLGALQAGAGDKDRLAAELAASQASLAALQAGAGDKDKRIAELEGQLAGRDKELAGLRGELSAEMAKLNEAQRGLVRALRPEIEQGNITVDLNNERLLINLASSMLFGSGEDQLKPAGTDALKRVGAILKDYPEYKVEVDGHTDNRPIRSSLKKRFPTNKELSEARAANGVTALAEGGVSAGTIVSAGYADTKPVAPNATDEGRQKNRRVEVRVTPKS
jgi:chemotaxis protein MotB